MKKIHYILWIVLTITGGASGIKAQEGWNQDMTGIYSVGIGGTQVIALGSGAPYYYGTGLSVNVSGEYRVQRFIGLGFEAGLDVLHAPSYVEPVEGPYFREYPSVGIPVAVKLNIHILEAANVAIAEQLDVYAGLNFGGGPAFYTGPGGSAFGFLEVGPQFGVRYWLKRQIAVFTEFGWGATFANVGVSF